MKEITFEEDELDSESEDSNNGGWVDGDEVICLNTIMKIQRKKIMSHLRHPGLKCLIKKWIWRMVFFLKKYLLEIHRL